MPEKVRVGGLRGYTNLVRELGGDPQQLIRQCGISGDLLDNEDALISYRRLVHLLEETAADRDLPDFGLRLAARQDIGILGPLAVALQNSATVEEAMRCAVSYLFVQSPALALNIDRRGAGVRLQIGINLRQMPHDAMPQAEELALGVLHGVLGLLAPGQYTPLRVEIPHSPLSPSSVYEAYFGAKVYFDCDGNGLYVSDDTMSARLGHRSEHLQKMALNYLDTLSHAADETLTERVEAWVRKTLGTDSCNRESIAQAMAVHPRTLQRRLKAEETSFDDIRDRVRRETIDHYLRYSDMPLTQVAGLVGYSEQSILSRNCRRWFKQSPRSIRNAAQG